MTQDQREKLQTNEQTLAWLEKYKPTLADALKEALKPGGACMVQCTDGQFRKSTFGNYKGHVYRLPADFTLPVERNADGDSLEDLRAVQERFNRADALDVQRSDKLWHPASGWFLTGNLRILRIAAKHADTFNPATMDFKTWAQAVGKRDMVVKANRKGDVYYFTRFEGVYMVRSDRSLIAYDPMDWQWTAIAREAMQAELAAKAAPKQEETEDLPIEITGFGNAECYHCKAMSLYKWPTRTCFSCFVFADGSTDRRHVRKADGEVAVAVRVRTI